MLYTVKTGYVLRDSFSVEKSVIQSHESRRWKIWRTFIRRTTCPFCFSMNGRIISIDNVDIPVHDNCGCSVNSLPAILAGTATIDGKDGVDRYVALYGILPYNYHTREEAKAYGWKMALGNLREALPEAVIGGNVYKNRDHRLPESPGRIWYEADFNYTGGYRNSCRLLYSNDGLLFATYDHYTTFYEIEQEEVS